MIRHNDETRKTTTQILKRTRKKEINKIKKIVMSWDMLTPMRKKPGRMIKT